jgi:hypothetical protein
MGEIDSFATIDEEVASFITTTMLKSRKYHHHVAIIIIIIIPAHVSYVRRNNRYAYVLLTYSRCHLYSTICKNSYIRECTYVSTIVRAVRAICNVLMTFFKILKASKHRLYTFKQYEQIKFKQFLIR